MVKYLVFWWQLIPNVNDPDINSRIDLPYPSTYNLSIFENFCLRCVETMLPWRFRNLCWHFGSVQLLGDQGVPGPVRSGPGARTSVRSGPVCCGATRLLTLFIFGLIPFGQVLAAKAWKSNQIWLIQTISIRYFWSSGLVTLIPFWREWFGDFEMVWIIDYFFNLWQPKPVKKESKSPNQKIRIIEIEMNWISQIWLLFQSLAAKTCPKVIQVTKPEDQNYGIEMVWSQNLSKRNQNIWNRCMY